MVQTTLEAPKKWLYDSLLMELGRHTIEDIEIPREILDNINQDLELREYQKKALQNSIAYFEKYPYKKLPSQLLYNMATGSGKTLIMASLILYLYKKGYNKFLFFVNSNNIIDKTKSNFLDQNHIKYLFNKKIMFEGREVKIRQVNSFDATNKDEINICFTTIHKLHNDLNMDKENSLTMNYFKDKKIVLLSDEAHHSQAATKQKTLEEERNWETTVQRILEKNPENLLLEFTATMGIENDADIKEKYLDKLIFKYDLIDFRNDGFSKEPEIFKVDEDKKYRILTAVLINQYRQDIAQTYASKFKDSENLSNFKPVILFKATKTIDDSKENEKIFYEIIGNLTNKDLEDIRDRINHPIIKKIFEFYKKEEISISDLIKKKIKVNFSKKHCINVNETDLEKKSIKKEDEEEVITQQNLLNSLEDKNNKIRVIFAVQKLNEGWDVLNLYDIVRISEKQASGGGTEGGIAKATISEAQLVGRGVRYFPFKLEPSQKKNLRKYDEENHDLRILEELYFHCHPGDKGRYIAELKKAFEREGLGDTGLEDKEIKLKESFKKTPFYKTAKIYLNKPILKDTSKIQSFADLGFIDKNILYEIYSGVGETSKALDSEHYDNSKIIKKPKTMKILDIYKSDPHIIKNAIAKVFEFGNEKRGLKKYLPNLESTQDLLEKPKLLGDINIDFMITEKDWNNISNKDKLKAVVFVLEKIKEALINNYSRYEGSKNFFAKKAFGEEKEGAIFFNKTIRVKKNSERSKGDQDYLKDKEWYVFDSNYGTDQEKFCVKFIEKLRENNKLDDYEEIYLVRNELHLKIYDFDDGQPFSPDFVLFMKTKNGKEVSYQIFIEPKGAQYKGHDGTFETGKEAWKQKFLQRLQKEAKIEDLTKFEGKEFNIIGIRFYNKDNETEFEENLFNSFKK
jgi:type III restriction enzyme